MGHIKFVPVYSFVESNNDESQMMIPNNDCNSNELEDAITYIFKKLDHEQILSLLEESKKLPIFASIKIDPVSVYQEQYTIMLRD